MKIVDVIKKDHRDVEELFAKYEAGDDSLVDTILRELRLHSEAEETFVYPFMDQRDSEAEELENHAQREHDEIRAAMQEVEAAEDKAEAMAKLKEVVTHHVEDEENEFLPGLEERLGETADAEMFASWSHFKLNQG